MFGFLRRKPDAIEARSTVLADGSVTISDRTGMMQILGLVEMAAGEAVTIDTALGVPAVFAAVNFLSRSLASLPLTVFERTGTEVARAEGDLERILNEAWNEQSSSFDARKYGFDQVFTGGRMFVFIERNQLGKLKALWPLNPEQITIIREGGKKRYDYREGARTVHYAATDIIDVPFMLKADGLSHRSPITSCGETISMAIAATKFGGAFFRGGGVPTFAISGNFQSGGAMQRAADDMEDAVRKAAREKRQALVLPTELKLTPLGVDAEKAQLIETQRFMVEQIARIYSLPPIFLQDLSHGTFANTEQQDLHLVKHTLRAWVKQFEDEMNLKLFGPENRNVWVRHNMDGLLRGDFKTRSEGYGRGIQTGQITPNEVRALEGRDSLPGGDGLYMQGAMLPIGLLGVTPPSGTAGQAGDGTGQGGQNDG